MAHFVLRRANLAAWAVGTVVTDAEFWSFDEDSFKSINGDDGGAWAPGAAIDIGGAGLLLSGANHALSGTLSVTGTIQSDPAFAPPRLEWHGNTGDLDVNSGGDINVKTGGEAYFEAGSALWQYAGAAWSLAGTTTVANAGVVAVAAGGTLNAQAGSTVNLAGTNNLVGDLVIAIQGKIRQRFLAGADSAATYSSATTDVVLASGLTAPRIYTLDPGAHGHTVRVVNKTAHTVTVAGLVGGGTASLTYASGAIYAADFAYSDGSAGAPAAGWHLVSSSPYDA